MSEQPKSEPFQSKIETCPKCGSQGVAFICDTRGCPMNGGAAYPWTEYTPSLTPDPTRPGTEGEEMRESIRKAIKDRWDLLTGPALDHGHVITGSWRRKDLCREFAEVLLAGPLARLLSDLTAAREERDEARRQILNAVGEVNPPLQDGVWSGTLTEAIAATNVALEAAEAEASKLRADLHESAMQHLARDVADEQAWGEMAALRERVAKLEAQLGASASQTEPSPTAEPKVSAADAASVSSAEPIYCRKCNEKWACHKLGCAWFSAYPKFRARANDERAQREDPKGLSPKDASVVGSAEAPDPFRPFRPFRGLRKTEEQKP